MDSVVCFQNSVPYCVPLVGTNSTTLGIQRIAPPMIANSKSPTAKSHSRPLKLVHHNEFSVQKRPRLEEFIFLNINFSTSKSKLFNSWIAIFKFFSYCLCGRMYFNFWFCGKPCSWLKNVHPIILCYIERPFSISKISIDENRICLSCNDTIKFERHLTCARARPTSCFFIIIRNHL